MKKNKSLQPSALLTGRCQTAKNAPSLADDPANVLVTLDSRMILVDKYDLIIVVSSIFADMIAVEDFKVGEFPCYAPLCDSLLVHLRRVEESCASWLPAFHWSWPSPAAFLDADASQN